MKMNLLEKIALIAMGVILMGVTIFVPSCQTTVKNQGTAPTDQLHNIGAEVGSAGTDLQTTTKVIKDNATQGQSATPPSLLSLLNPFWSNILTAVGTQDQIAKNLADTTVKAAAAEKQSAEFQQQFNDEHAKRIAAEDNVTKELRQKYMAFSGILFFISLILFGVAIWSGGNKILLWGGAIAGVGAAVCIFIVQTVVLIPWIIGGLALICIGFLVYSYVHKSKVVAAATATVVAKTAQIASFSNSTRELVETIEASKPKMTVAGRKAMFGDGPGKGDAFAIQSRETEKLVQHLRMDMEKAPSIPATVAVDVNGDGIIDEKDMQTALVAPTRPVSPSRKVYFK